MIIRRALAIAVILLGLTATNAQAVTRMPDRCKTTTASKLCAIHFHYDRTNILRHKMRLNPIRYQWRAEKYPGKRVTILTYWTRTHARHVSRLKHYHPIQTTSYSSSQYSGLLCIHKYEGAWNANTGNGFYGGLQMDSSFMQTYGPEFYRQYGTANNWPVIDQLIAGYRAVTGNGNPANARGYTPWPNTRLMCGI